MYGRDTWTTGGADSGRLEAFEMWCHRRMPMIRWVARITNEEVPDRPVAKRGDRRHRGIVHVAPGGGVWGYKSQRETERRV